jgi:hypothetical protein
MSITAFVDTLTFRFLTVAGTLLGAGVGAGWLAATAFQSSELAGYKASQAARLPDAVRDLQGATGALRLSAEERKDYVALQLLPRRVAELNSTIASLTLEVTNLHKDVAVRASERDALQARLAAIVSPRRGVLVYSGQSSYLIPNLLLVGVQQVLATSCSATVEGKTVYLHVGERFEGQVADIAYHINLTAVDGEGCRFDFFNDGKAASAITAPSVTTSTSSWFTKPTS